MENILNLVSVVLLVIMVVLMMVRLLIYGDHLGRNNNLPKYDTDTWTVKETKIQEFIDNKQQEYEKKKVDYQDFKELKESHAELYIKFINLEQRMKELEAQAD